MIDALRADCIRRAALLTYVT